MLVSKSNQISLANAHTEKKTIWVLFEREEYYYLYAKASAFTPHHVAQLQTQRTRHTETAHIGVRYASERECHLTH